VAWVLVPPVAGAGFLLALEKVSLGRSGSPALYGILDALNLGFALLPVVLLLGGFLCLIFVKDRGVGGALLASCLLFTLLAAAITELRWRMRMSAFAALAQRSEGLVRSLHDYERLTGRPASTLAALVPEYLPAVPATGVGAYPRFEYQPLEAGDLGDNAWILYVPLTRSPESRLVYLPNRDYERLGQEIVALGQWAHVAQRIEIGY
jgi:hypothetical protein